MKLSQVLAKLTSGKVKVLSTLGGLAIAGVAMTVVAPAAKAQVAFGIEVGRPGYYAPTPQPVYVNPEAYGYAYGSPRGYDARAYWEHRRYEDFRAREWRERDFRDRSREFHRDRGYDGRGWR